MPDYWVIDGDAQAFEAWRPDELRPAVQDERLSWRPAGAPEPFVLDMREFFTEVAD